MQDTATDVGLAVFVDESIHVRGDFIVVAAICAESRLQKDVTEALIDFGFDPERDEFKSSLFMNGNLRAQGLRSRLQVLLRHSKIAIAVCPTSERAVLADHVAELLARLDLAPDEHFTSVYFDEGIKRASAIMPANVEYGCDSRFVRGIQLADCAAHLIATMLLDQLGLFSKTVKASTAYEGQEGEIELAWTLWASIRHALAGLKSIGPPDEYGTPEPRMRPFGLLVSEACSDAVKAAVEKRLGTIWIGCIH